MAAQRCELNYDFVRQEITHIQNVIDKKTRQDLTAMIGARMAYFLRQKFWLLNLEAVKLNHDRFRRSCHSRSCNLRV